MKYRLLIWCFFLSLICFAQTDSGRKIEPAQKTSFENYELLLLAIAGLLLLIGLRFWFRRTRKR